MSELLEKTVGANNSHITLAKVNAGDPILQKSCDPLGLQSIPALSEL